MNNWPSYENAANLNQVNDNDSSILPLNVTLSSTLPINGTSNLNSANPTVPSTLSSTASPIISSNVSQDLPSSHLPASSTLPMLYKPQVYDRNHLMQPPLTLAPVILHHPFPPYSYNYEYNAEQDSTFPNYADHHVHDQQWENQKQQVLPLASNATSHLNGSGNQNMPGQKYSILLNQPLSKLSNTNGLRPILPVKETKLDVGHASTPKSPTGAKGLSKRSRMGCLTCRSRKKRCCETRPKCTECARLKFNCVWPEPGTEHKNKSKDIKQDGNMIDHEVYGKIKVLRGIVEYRSEN